MEKILKDIEALTRDIGAITPITPYRGNALQALSAARDNLKWHGEWCEAEAKRKADEAAKATAETSPKQPAKA